MVSVAGARDVSGKFAQGHRSSKEVARAVHAVSCEMIFQSRRTTRCGSRTRRGWDDRSFAGRPPAAVVFRLRRIVPATSRQQIVVNVFLCSGAMMKQTLLTRHVRIEMREGVMTGGTSSRSASLSDLQP